MLKFYDTREGRPASTLAPVNLFDSGPNDAPLPFSDEKPDE